MKKICKQLHYCFEYGRWNMEKCDERCGERFFKLVMQTYKETNNEWLHDQIKKEYHL